MPWSKSWPKPTIELKSKYHYHHDHRTLKELLDGFSIGFRIDI